LSVKLGIDTGGTYTDAILFDDENGVLATAKSLTTRHDLAIGIRDAMSMVLDKTDTARTESIELVAISTTLATNAIVEGEGARTCLILIGQPEAILERSKLGAAVGDDYVIRIAGGHSASGEPQQDLDSETLIRELEVHSQKVQSFAIASYFAVRNPAHEIAAQKLITETTGLPVSLSHELSSSLDAPRRALTTLFNARLIPLLRELIKSVRSEMDTRKIKAALMVVQGDGSLVEAGTALLRPVETILSGPAASVNGARYLARIDDALISDIGGTTTDIAVIRNGLPEIDNDGATVAQWRTMVRAVRVHTVGLGGDSEVSLDDRNEIVLGPRRAIPLTLAAREFSVIEDALTESLRHAPHRLDGEFAVRIRQLDGQPTELTTIEQETWDLLSAGPCSLERLFANPRRESALARLRRRGLITRIGFTPTDAAHVTGLQNHLNTTIASLGAEIWARRCHYSDAQVFSKRVIFSLNQQSGRALTEAALMTEKVPPEKLDEWFVQRSFNPESDRLLRASLSLSLPVVGIGAPAASFYPQVAELLKTSAVIPDNAQVCNAVGAVVSGVLRTVDMLITSPTEGLYRLHSPEGISDHDDRQQATDHGCEIGRRLANAAALAAGARDIRLEQSVHHEVARGADGTETYIEGRISVAATGEPDI